MKPQPILIKYTVESVTEVEGVDVVTQHTNTKKWFLPDLLGPSCFIKEVDVSVNSVTICEGNRHSNLYQALNRRFSKKSDRRKAGTTHVYNTSAEVTSMGGKLIGNMTGSAGGLLMLGGFDGVPYLGPPRSLTAQAIYPQSRYSNFPDLIPPETEVHIRMTLHDNPTLRLARVGRVVSAYYKDKKPTTGNDKTSFEAEEVPTTVRISLVSIHLCAQQATFGESSSLYKMLFERKNLEFFYDKPYFSIYSIPDGLQFHTSVHALPPTADVALVCFMPGFVLFGDDAHKRPSDVTCAVLPKNLVRVNVLVNDQAQGFPGGIGIKTANPANCEEYALYYNWLHELGIVEMGWLEYTSSTDRTFNNIFLQDLRAYKKDGKGNENTRLTVSLEYGADLQGNLAEKGFHVVVVAPTEKKFERHANGSWTAN